MTYERLNKMEVRCTVCGASFEAPEGMHIFHGCDPTPPPVNVKPKNRIMQFASEYAKWAYYGFPTRSAERRIELHKICENCPSGLYDKASDSCRSCGCNMSITDPVSKIRWASTACPQNHWKADV